MTLSGGLRTVQHGLKSQLELEFFKVIKALIIDKKTLILNILQNHQINHVWKTDIRYFARDIQLELIICKYAVLSKHTEWLE